jgi:hypothetical protein
MANTAMARIRSIVEIARVINDDVPIEYQVPIRYEHKGHFGSVGAPGFTDDIDDIDEVFFGVIETNAAPVEIDLTALVEPPGRDVSFARIRYIEIVNLSTDDPITIEGGASNPWAPLIGTINTFSLAPSTAVNPSRLMLVLPSIAAGAVSGSSKTLAFDPGANAVDVALTLLGIKA